MGKRKIVIFFFLFVLSASLFAQGDDLRGLSFLTNYTISDYNAEDQNWKIIQDTSGVIFVANQSGVLEYNGIQWNLYKTSRGSVFDHLLQLPVMYM